MGGERNPRHQTADAESILVRRALEAEGWEVLPPEDMPTDDLVVFLQECVSRCDVFIAFATNNYGEKTPHPMCTHKEFVMAERYNLKFGRMAIVHINMRTRVESDAAMFRGGLPDGVFGTNASLCNLRLIYSSWLWAVTEPTAIPDGLLDAILRAAKSLPSEGTGVGAATAVCSEDESFDSLTCESVSDSDDSSGEGAIATKL
jgi:hypothetical protein